MISTSLFLMISQNCGHAVTNENHLFSVLIDIQMKNFSKFIFK